MVDKSKKGKKRTISEEDMSVLLQRYSLNTVLGMLQEVEQSAGEKVDWREMAKNTATGISCAREYQMLWRHIAYGEALTDQFDNDAEPIDDDSDLEHEVEVLPSVGREASVEASAYVKVLIASGYPHNSLLPSNSTIEAPLTINIPNSKAVSASPDGSLPPVQGRNISIPVSVQKQPLPSVVGEKRPNNEVSEVNLPSRKRRKSWSLEDDTKLTASVQKHGERNWANIANTDFKNDRRPTELSQRWSNLRKKQGNTKAGTSSQPAPETQIEATRRAMNLALMPTGDNLKSASHMTAAGIKTQHQPLKASAPPANRQFQRVGPSKPQMLANRLAMDRMSERESMVKAAAVAAGARIATPADASSLIEAARSQKNVVHMTTGGSSGLKSSTASVPNQLPSNVHFIRHGLVKAPISTYSAPKPNISETGGGKPAQSLPAKPAGPTVHSPVGSVPVSSATPVKKNAAVSTPSTKLPGPAEDRAVSSDIEKKESRQSNQGADPAELPVCAPVEQQPENQPAATGNQTSSGNALKENTEGDKASVPVSKPLSQTTDGVIALPSSEVGDDAGKTSSCGDLSSKETAENINSNEKPEDIPSTSTNEPAI